jgi:predicted phosphodiesterase
MVHRKSFFACLASILTVLLATVITLGHQGEIPFPTQAPSDSVRPLVIYGDTRNNHAVHRKVVECIMKYRPEAVFHTGDLVFNGKSKDNWVVFNDIVAELVKIAPMYAAFGNHELGTINIQQEQSIPAGKNWYSVNLQNIHFVLLDLVSGYSPGSEQYQWLKSDLENQPATTKFTVVITHYPFFSSSFHQTQTKKLRKELVPLFKSNGVDAVFSGHNHCYERCYSDGIYYITTAGGGAPLYQLKKPDATSQLFIRNYHFCTLTQQHDSLFVTAIDTNLVQIDRFFIH